MSAIVVDDAYVAVPLLGSVLSENDIVHHPAIAMALTDSLAQLRAVVESV